jgi:GTP-binding protein
VPRFIISAARPDQFPPETGIEIAFLGRSNVGKSSLLNALLSASVGSGVEKATLAKTSATPGCTQWINFYQTGEGLRFADLPGYGFAKVPKEIANSWKRLIDRYLTGRESLRLSVIVLDARRGWMVKDVELRDWLDANGRPYIVVATKMDKLKSQKERHQSLKNLQAGYAGEIFECSAVTGRGVREICQAIQKIKK